MRPGDIFLAQFLFGDVPGMKLRPVLLLTGPIGTVPEVFGCLHLVRDPGAGAALRCITRSAQARIPVHRPENYFDSKAAQVGNHPYVKSRPISWRPRSNGLRRRVDEVEISPHSIASKFCKIGHGYFRDRMSVV